MYRWGPSIAGNRRRRARAVSIVVFALSALGCPESAGTDPSDEGGWSPAELELLRSLSLGALPELPESPSNRVADEPLAARMGERLFFDPGLSRNGEVACATCHLPELHFTDAKPTAAALGQTRRNTPTVVGAAYSPWLFWDGRRDSLWSQALAPMESAAEMGNTRLEIARFVTQEPRYADDYTALFGSPPDFGDASRFPPRASPYADKEGRQAWERLPEESQREVNRAFSNAGKAIEAYERLLVPGPSRFDRYVEQLLSGDARGSEQWLTPEEVVGLRLFVDAGRTQCLRCHNGPLFTNHSFHNVASGRLGDAPDLGRFLGIQSLLLDVFNCLGPYSDAGAASCQELRFLARREAARQSGAFKTPTLREVGRTAPYFHNGDLATLDRVIAYYRDPPADAASELMPLEISDEEARKLVAFLGALSGGVATSSKPGFSTPEQGAAEPE